MYNPHSTVLRMEYLHKLFGTFLRGRIAYFPPLFIYSTIYCDQCGLWVVTLGYNPVLVSLVVQAVQLWPLGAPPTGSWDPPTGPSW